MKDLAWEQRAWHCHKYLWVHQQHVCCRIEPKSSRPECVSLVPLPCAPLLPPQRAQGIESLFAIQAQTLPHGLAGFDVVGRARTGCGKTLAFSLPIVERLLKDKAGGQFQVGQGMGRPPSCIVMAPTRELAKQVCVAG